MMRNPGEKVAIIKENLDEVIRLHPKKRNMQQLGLALDRGEKSFYTRNFEGWIEPPNPYGPYDVSGHDIFVDFKLYSADSLTIQADECLFGDSNGNYFLFIYKKLSQEWCVFEGVVSYSEIKQFLEPSNENDSKYARIGNVRDHLIT